MEFGQVSLAMPLGAALVLLCWVLCWGCVESRGAAGWQWGSAWDAGSLWGGVGRLLLNRTCRNSRERTTPPPPGEVSISDEKLYLHYNLLNFRLPYEINYSQYNDNVAIK